MSWEAIGAIGEVVGAVAVLVTLIYLAQQIRQNTRSMDESRRLAITQQWAAYGGIAYTFEDSLVLGNRGGIEYTSKCRCWAAGIEVSHDRAHGVQFNLVYRLLGMGKALDYQGPQNVGLGDLGLLDGF